jgi:hypothetical protein
MRGQQLSTHFAAHLQRLKDHSHETPSVRDVAITLAEVVGDPIGDGPGVR